MRSSALPFLVAGILCVAADAGEPKDLMPRVPARSIDAARRVTNPLVSTPEHLEKGRELYLRKGFCSACHGRDGKGLGSGVDYSRLRGALPRDLTDPAWQRARTDGELLWILRNGSQETAMASFVPLVLDEEEAWQVLLYVRSLGQR